MGVKRIFELYALYAKMDLAWLLRDTTFAVLAVVTDIVTNLSAVAGVFLLAWRFDGIGGMARFEVLFMLAYASIVTGIFQVFCSGGNTGHISRRIGRGQLEHMFIQPVPLPVGLATEGFIPFSGSSNLLSGIVIMVVAIVNLELTLPWWWVLSLVGNLLVSFSIVLGKAYFSSSLAFYAPVQAEEISTFVVDTFGHISTFPLSGMPVGLQWTLITVIPAGLLAWFPTLVLFGRAPFGLAGWYPLAFAVGLWGVALYFFRKGLRFYVKKGINRYSAMGHRR